MTIDISGKTALICGSSAGIGKAIAEQMALSGATIVLMARDGERLEEVCSSLNTDNGQQHLFLVADFNDPESVGNKIVEYLDQGKGIDILVNNSGGPPPGPAHLAATEDYVKAFRQHLLCNQILAQSVVKGMKNNRSGRIINIISTSVKQPIPGLGVSNTIRGAVASWSKTLATEMAPFGITVNNVLPGATKTGRLEGIINNKAERSGKTKEEAADQMREVIPAKRFATPEEIAYAAVFLASEQAAYINGINIAVDGGRTGCL